MLRLHRNLFLLDSSTGFAPPAALASPMWEMLPRRGEGRARDVLNFVAGQNMYVVTSPEMGGHVQN